MKLTYRTKRQIAACIACSGALLIGFVAAGAIDVTGFWMLTPVWCAVSSIVIVLLLAAVILAALY